MKPTYSVLFLLFLTTAVLAQPTDTAMLCQGHYYTEAEGKAALERFAHTYQDVSSWEARADRVRQGIWEGLGLTAYFERTPLNPIKREK